jgi:hypothetical protein
MAMRDASVDVTDTRWETSSGDYEMALMDVINEFDMARLFLRSQVEDLWEEFLLSLAVL